MGATHDLLATKCGDQILNKIRKADPKFQQIFSTSMVRTGDWGWPRPDYVCYDSVNDFTYALEFKPPYQTKREYLTGLGQSLSYLQKHNYSGLILPEVADDGFEIAKFVKKTLASPEFSNVTTSLYSYDLKSHTVKIIRPITTLRTSSIKAKTGKDIKTFWCWWRDISQYEVYDLLNLSFKFSDKSGDIYSTDIFPEFYKQMLAGKTKQWDGTRRHKTAPIGSASYKAEKQNYKIPLVQLELWTNSEGRLTDLGFELLSIGKKYGPDSDQFIKKLARLLLVEGRHLDLINLIDGYQKDTTIIIPNKSDDYKVALDNYLTSRGCIGKRKPTAVTTGKKKSYVRDEPKLWNKLGLVETSNTGYFVPNEGYRFNWEKITDILI
ncbi:MAG: hypothetical protein E7307_01135 [Butyrivibrio sp.]|nr:hypothetical protein [Butyrivibrio sp.]